MGHKPCHRVHDLRLVKADTMREYLDSGVCQGRVGSAGHAELGADVVTTRDSRIARQSCSSEVLTLRSHVLNKGGGIEVRLRDRDVTKDGIARRDVHGDGDVVALLSSNTAGQKGELQER